MSKFSFPASSGGRVCSACRSARASLVSTSPLGFGRPLVQNVHVVTAKSSQNANEPASLSALGNGHPFSRLAHRSRADGWMVCFNAVTMDSAQNSGG